MNRSRPTFRKVRELQAIGDPEYPSRFAKLVSLGDDRHVIALDDMDALMLCDVEAGRVISCVLPEDDSIRAVTRLGDGRRIVTVRFEAVEVRDAFDLTTVVATIPRVVETAPHDVAAHPDGRRIAIVDADGLHIWDLEAGQQIAHASVRDVDGVACDSQGTRIYTFGEARNASLQAWSWDGERLASPGCRASRAVPQPDGRLLVLDGELHVWSAAREEADFSCFVKGFHETAEDVAVLEQGRYAVTAHFTGALALWDLATGCALEIVGEARTAHQNHAVAISPRRFVVASGIPGTLELWELATTEDAPTRSGLGYCTITAIGDEAALARSPGGGSCVIDLETGEPRPPLLPAGKRPSGDVIYADDRVALCHDAWYLQLVDRATGSYIAGERDNYFDRAGAIATVAREGTLVGGCLYDRRHADVIDLRARTRHRLGPHDAPVVSIALAGDDRLVAACDDGVVIVWSLVDDTKALTVRPSPTARVHAVVAPSGNASWFAVLDAERTRTFDLATGAPRAELPAAADAVAVGTELVTRHASWDAHSGACLARWDAAVGDEWIATRHHVAWLDPTGMLRVIDRRHPS